MSVIKDLIAELGTVCAGLRDRRTAPRRDGDYTMADIGLSAFALFFMGSPSFLAHQRALQRGQGRSNCQTLFGTPAPAKLVPAKAGGGGQRSPPTTTSA